MLYIPDDQMYALEASVERTMQLARVAVDGRKAALDISPARVRAAVRGMLAGLTNSGVPVIAEGEALVVGRWRVGAYGVQKDGITREEVALRPGSLGGSGMPQS